MEGQQCQEIYTAEAPVMTKLSMNYSNDVAW